MPLNLILVSVLLHPVHETVSEVQWNRDTKSVEVAIRLDALDEQWIDQQFSSAGTSGEATWTEPQKRIAYLRRNLRVSPLPSSNQRDDDGSITHVASGDDAYRWIGRQPEGAHVWWYISITPKNKSIPRWIENRMLLDRDTNYQHRVLFLDETPTRSMNLSRQKPRTVFSKTPDNEAVPSD